MKRAITETLEVQRLGFIALTPFIIIIGAIFILSPLNEMMMETNALAPAVALPGGFIFERILRFLLEVQDRYKFYKETEFIEFEAIKE